MAKKRRKVKEKPCNFQGIKKLRRILRKEEDSSRFYNFTKFEEILGEDNVPGETVDEERQTNDSVADTKESANDFHYKQEAKMRWTR